tara:strand:+ start:883 stop:1263 length:381 start_codon:yes stop_codon:yes gene_type:complete
MSAQTDRLEALTKEIEAVDEMLEELRETRKTLGKEFNSIHRDLHAKKMRKRKWAFITANTGSETWAYGMKVQIIHHTRKSKRHHAGAWVKKRNLQQWFPYRSLSPTKPEHIGVNRMIATSLNKAFA